MRNRESEDRYIKTSISVKERLHAKLKAWSALGGVGFQEMVGEALEQYCEKLPQDPRFKDKGILILEATTAPSGNGGA